MSFYSLPQQEHSGLFDTDFRPNPPINNPDKSIIMMQCDNFTLLVIKNTVHKLIPKIIKHARVCHQASTYLVTLFQDLGVPDLQSRLLEYATVDFCSDYLDTFDKQLVATMWINTYNESDELRVIELGPTIVIQDVVSTEKPLRSRKNLDSHQITMAMALATFADKRNFAFSYIWCTVDPYSPDWKYWAEVYTSLGFSKPSVVLETPSKRLLSNEMIELTRTNNFTGSTTDSIIMEKITRYHKALLGYMSSHCLCVALKWAELGNTLQHEVGIGKVSGALYLAKKDGKHRILRVGDVKPRLLMWPSAIKSTDSLEGISLTFTTAKHCTDDLLILSNHILFDTGLPCKLFIHEHGITLLQCTSDYVRFLEELKNDPQKKSLITFVYKSLQGYTEGVSQLRFSDLTKTMRQNVPNSMQGLLETCLDTYQSKERTALFRVAEQPWSDFRSRGLVYAYLFNVKSSQLEYKTEMIV